MKKCWLTMWTIMVFAGMIQTLRGNESHAMLDVSFIRGLAAEATVEKYPNADSVMLDDKIVITYQADGTSETWDDTAVKVMTERGKKSHGMVSLGYNISYNKAEFTLVEIIKPDGRHVVVDLAKNAKEMISSGQMSSNIYDPHHKTLRVGVPGLEAGDILRYIIHRKTYKSRVTNTFCYDDLFEYTNPIMNYSVEINGPAECPLKSIALKDEIKNTVTYTKREVGNRIIYKWQVKDVPRMFGEPNMPDLSCVVQRLVVSTAANWEEISRWYWKVCEKHFQTTPEMAAKVAELCENKKNDDDKIQAIFKFVSQEIRYMGITLETEAPGYEPHDVALTFNNRHGVCRDKAALLVAMLRLAKIDAYPVLISVGPKMDEEVPIPYFNHAITAVRMGDGQYELMDSTNETTKELFPAYLCNHSMLIAHPDGMKLKVSPITPASRNMMKIVTDMNVDADGNLTGESWFMFEGYNDNGYRATMTKRTPEERRQFFESVVKNIAAGTRLVSMELKPDNMQDTSKPMTLHLKFAADRIMIDNGKYAMCGIPDFATSVGMVNFVQKKAGLETRKYPFVNGVACGVHEIATMKFDPSWGVPAHLPKYPDIDNETIRRQCRLAFSENTLRQETDYTIKVVEFSPQQYLELKKDLKRFDKMGKMPIFTCQGRHKKASAEHAETVKEEKTETSADSLLLYGEDIYTLSDEYTWSRETKVRKKILSYKGKKDNSEVKLSYAPAYDTLELQYARVITDDVIKEISEEEKNLMDASWVASAPRYSPTKILVASLPGVEVGSIIEYCYTRTGTSIPPFNNSFTFRGFNPIQRYRLVIRIPETLDCNLEFYPGGWLAETRGAVPVKVKKTREKNWVVHSWEVEDVPALKREGDVPSLGMFQPTVSISMGAWKTYLPEVFKALKRRAVPGEAVKTLAGQVASGDQLTMLRAVRDRIMQNVRIAGPNFLYVSLEELSNAETTLTSGYGNVADRAILFYTLLTELGFKPEFVLANGNTFAESVKHYRKAGNFHAWGTVLVRVRLGGKVYWLNDSDKYAELLCTSYDNCSAIDEKGSFFTIRAPKGYQNRTESDKAVEIHADGSAHVVYRTTYYGLDCASRKRFFAEQTPEERKRYFQELMSGLSQSAVPAGELVTDFDSYPGVVSYAADVKRYSTVADSFLYYKGGNPLAGYVNPRTDSRSNPLFWGGYRRLHEHLLVTLPEGFSEEMLPESVTWKTPTGKGVVSRKVKRTQTGIDFFYQADMAPEYMKADCYGKLLDFSRILHHPSFTTVLLKNNQGAEHE